MISENVQPTSEAKRGEILTNALSHDILVFIGYNPNELTASVFIILINLYL